ncbi:MAG: hypothetical protein J5449_00385 [Oscillospiraceae bacterium]|nr:hypothetical protein [Oscillospiraceae bacterium]
MAYSIDPISADCYPGTSVLINKFDICDEEKLNEIESVVSSARSAEWLNAPQTATSVCTGRNGSTQANLL